MGGLAALQAQIAAMQTEMVNMQAYINAQAAAAASSPTPPPPPGATITVPGLNELVSELRTSANRDQRLLVDQRGLGRPTVYDGQEELVSTMGYEDGEFHHRGVPGGTRNLGVRKRRAGRHH